MLPWMLYIVVVSLLLSGATLAAERVALLRRAPTRWLWLTAIVASLLIPAAIASISIQLPRIPNVVSPALSQKIVVLRQTTSSALSPSLWLDAGAPQLSTLPHLDTLLQRAWVTASATLLLILLASGTHLYWRKRRWERGTIAGIPVYIAEHAGPAVVGLLRPRILVPRWLTEAPAAVQDHVIAHERAHLQGHDTRLLTAALFLLVCMPWNPLLWWQLQRLRYAIEVDCDARVLEAGHEVSSYGETLIAVCQRQSGYIGAVAGMSESRSFLEERIKIMMHKPAKWWRAAAVACGCLSFGLVAVAAQVEPPNVGGAYGDHHEIELAASTLDRYTGYYKFQGYMVMSVTRDGQQLSSQMSGQQALPIYPESATAFFFKAVDAQIDFVSDVQGNVTGLVHHQHGRDFTMPRIDATTAQQIAAALAAKVQSQSPTPGSEAAVRRLIAGVADGKPDYDEMSPVLADAVRKQLPQLQSANAVLGPVVSIKFMGVGNQGWDIYQLTHEHGASQVRIALDSNGIIIGALSSMGP